MMRPAFTDLGNGSLPFCIENLFDEHHYAFVDREKVVSRFCFKTSLYVLCYAFVDLGKASSPFIWKLLCACCSMS